MRRNLTAVGDSATKMGLGITAAAGLAAKAAIDWESAWAGVTKTVDGSAAQMDELEQGLRNLAKTLPSTHTEIAAVAEAAGQLGVAREDIVSFTKTMINLGETTNLTADDAATAIAQLANVMGTSGDEIDNLGSTLVALGNDGASTEAQIIQMAQRIAGAAKTVGLSEGEVLAFANTVASMGIDVEAGGTAVSTVIATMARAAASGGPKLEAFASTAGVTAEEFAKSFKDKPADAIVSFIQGLERTQQAGGNLYAQLDAVGLQDIRVSQALIGMASSGDLLTDSLKLQKTAWEQNTALTDEAAKRYDTTAAQTAIAWNSIKDAAIDAGEGIIPVVSAIADGVTGLADTFGGLPGPVKSGVGALAGIAGVSALAAGGMIKLSTALVAQRGAMVALGIATPASTAAVAGLSRAAIGATTAISGLYAAHLLLEKDQTEGVQEYTRDLLGLASGTKSAKEEFDNLFKVGNSNWSWITASKKDIMGLDDAFKSIDTNFIEDVGNFGSSLFGTWDDKGDLAANSFKKVDAALEGLVQSGATEQAADGFEYLATRAEKNGVSVDRLREILPRYGEALAGVENANDVAGEKVDEFGNAVSSAEAQVKKYTDALNALLDPYIGQDQASNAWKDSLESLTDALKENGRTLDDGTTKGRANQDAVRARVEALRDSVAADSEAGASQQDLQAKLTRGAKKILAAGEAAGIAKGEMKKYLEQLNLTPEQIDTLITADTDTAMNKVRSLQQFIDGMNGKTVKVNVEGGTPGGILRAEGGPVFGPGTATSDSIPAMLSNGEHVLTAKDVSAIGGQSAVYRMRAMASAGMLPRFATGGAVTSKPTKLEIKEAESRVRDIERSLDERETIKRNGKKERRNVLRGLDREIANLQLTEAKQALRDLKSNKAARDEAAQRTQDEAEEANQKVADQKLSAKNGSIAKFGIGALSSAAAVDRSLGKLLADSQTFLGLLGDLKAKGASPWLLAQLVEAGPTPGAIRLARQYATDQGALDQINARAGQIEAYGNQYANLVGNPAFMQAGAWSSGISSASQGPITAEIVGAEFSVNGGGMLEFVKGQIIVAQDQQAMEVRFAS